MVTKTLEDYLQLAYKIEVFKDSNADNPGWVASVPDLPGCITQADTFDELGSMIEDAKRAWLEAALERGIPIPEPHLQEEYSGKFVVRVPRSLHRKLVEQAEAEGVSLNQYINVALASEVSSHPRRMQSQATTERWPGLSGAIFDFLSASGFMADAENLDQQLFSSWFEWELLKHHQSIEGEDYHAALMSLGKLKEELSSFANREPFIQLLDSVLSIWSGDIRNLINKLMAVKPTKLEILVAENMTDDYKKWVDEAGSNRDISPRSNVLDDLFNAFGSKDG